MSLPIFTDAQAVGSLVHLLPGLRHCDEQAWAALNQRARPLLYRYARKHGLGSADAESIAQQTLLTAYLSLERFNPDGKPKPLLRWLLGIAHHLGQAVRRCRRPALMDPAELNRLADARPTSREPAAALDERRAQLNAAVEHVRPDFEKRTFEAFELVVLRGKTAGEAAAMLHMTGEAVRMAKSRVLKRLREEVAAN